MTKKEMRYMSNQDDNRVLSRRGARIVTVDEAQLVNGGYQTETLCSFNPKYGPDGDVFTNDCIAN